MPTIRRRDILSRRNPDQKKRAENVSDESNRDGAGNQDQAMQDRQPFQFTEEKADHERCLQ